MTTLGQFDANSYTAIGVVILIVTTVTAVMLIVAHVFGPKRHGPVKDSPYESGVPIISDSRRRFHIRFYLVAMLFMLFDVEIIFLWPWALSYFHVATTDTMIRLDNGAAAGKGFLLAGMGLFFLLLVFGLVYEWMKGALEWD